MVYLDDHGYGAVGEIMEKIFGRCSYVQEFSYWLGAAPWRGEEGRYFLWDMIAWALTRNAAKEALDHTHYLLLTVLHLRMR